MYSVSLASGSNLHWSQCLLYHEFLTSAHCLEPKKCWEKNVVIKANVLSKAWATNQLNAKNLAALIGWHRASTGFSTLELHFLQAASTYTQYL
jgi:hypothetical protein